jgi:hypothetical protein
MGVAHDALGDATHEGKLNSAESPAPHDYQVDPQLFGQADDVLVFLAGSRLHPKVGLRNVSTGALYLFHQLVEPLPGHHLVMLGGG